jgi:PAS domain S-box-containing protein
MKPLTAMGLLLAGAALRLLRRNYRIPLRRKLGLGFSFLVALIGGLVLLEYQTDINFGLDLWLFRDAVLAEDELYPGRPSASIAYCLLLAGIALMTLDAGAVWLAPFLALQILLLSLFALVGYGYGVSVLNQIKSYTPFALHTAVSLFVLALGLLSARSQRCMSWMNSHLAGSIIALRLLPAAFLLPFAIDLLELKAHRSGLFDNDLDWAFFVTFHIVVFSGLIYGAAKLLGHTDAERKAGFIALRESEERFRLLFDASPSGVLMTDLEGKIKLANRQAETLFGYAAGRLPGQKIETLLRDPAQERHYEHPEPFAVALRSGAKKAGGEMTGLRRDGTEFVALIDWNPLATPKDEMLLITLVDITERKRIEEDRNRFVALANASEEFIGMCDQDFKPFYVNPAGLRMIGLENFNAVSRVRVQDCFFPEDRTFITHEFFPRVMREGHAEVEIRFRHFQTGEALWMLYNVFNLHDENGRISGWATVSRNIHQHKQAQEALIASEKRLQLALQASKGGAWDWEMARGVATVSDSYRELYGLTPDQPVSFDSWLGTVHPDDRDRCRAYCEEYFRTEKEFNIQFRILHPQHGLLWLEGIGRLERDAEGRPIRFIGINLDISKRKAAEEALRESEERLRLAWKATREAIWDWDIVHDAQRWSVAGAEVFGWRDAVDAPQTAAWGLELMHPEDRARVLSGLRAALDDPACDHWEDEYRFVRADGNYADVLDRGFVIRDGQGKPIRMIGSMQDITERKRMEEKIRQINSELEQRVATRTLELESANIRLKNELIERERAEAETERFFTMSADLICIIDAEGDFRRVNAAFETALGYSLEELYSRPILDFVHPEELDATKAEMEKLTHGLPSIRYENRYRCKNGFYKWLGWTMQPAPEGTLYAIARDITERKLNEARIAASLQEKEVLLKEIHHRVKNNLQVIASLLRLQADNLSDPVARDSFLDSQQRVHSMALAHEHLYQSRGLASINMTEYISSLVNSTRRSYSESASSIELRIQIAEIELDIEQAVPLGLIISELVANSYKHAFTPPPANSPGKLWIKLANEGVDGLILEVGDNGRGMPDSVQITKPSSMGLHLVQSFVLQLKGHLTVQRRPGTVFSIFMPKKKR